ncbi:MAG: ABC-F family ATP-binding cassette domain-containing protein [Eubacteriales bacterium]|nr:ABC-F family ATP-binding cassette domain-containing protein [Eubacteriales bacterium]
MSIINVEHISKLYGDRMVLEDLSCSVEFGDKIGIIGINGMGKSTLLRMMAGEEEPDSGSVIFSRGLTVGWLPQNPEFREEETVFSYVCQGMEGDYGLESEAKSMLQIMELDDSSQRMAALSGGQKKRVALCRVLLQKADILILDEPTNHLDNRMADWLERFLIQYKGVLLLVTHDRYFLDRVTNKIWEIDRGSLYEYEANYSGFLEKKAQREEMEQAAERKRQSVLRVELQWVMRGARARSTKQKARLERFEYLQNMDSPQKAKQVELEAVGTRLGKKTIEVEEISKAYGENPLFSGFSYIFKRYDRIGFVGNNGCGKSTLMRILTGLEEPDSGIISWGETVKIGYFAQECESMDERQRVIDYIRDEEEFVRTTTGKLSASRMLERFLFTPDMQYTSVSKLSGGERRRLYLLRILMSSPNVLILDEPTNDLDIATLQVLEQFLDTFPGIAIVVSHDRYFLDRVADRIASFENGKICVYEGGYSEYLEKKKECDGAEGKIFHVEGSSRFHGSKKSGGKAEGEGKKNTWKSPSKKLRFTYMEQKEYDTIDEDIEALEEKLAQIEKEMTDNATNFVKLNEWMKEKEETERLLEEKTERWVYLTELMERIEEQKNEDSTHRL